MISLMHAISFSITLTLVFSKGVQGHGLLFSSHYKLSLTHSQNMMGYPGAGLRIHLRMRALIPPLAYSVHTSSWTCVHVFWASYKLLSYDQGEGKDRTQIF